MALMFSSMSFFLLEFIATQSIILCIASATLTGFTIPLIPPFSPESPFYQQNLTKHQQLNRLISETDYRNSPNNIQLPVNNVPPAIFVTKLVLGTPAKTQVLLIDTGSSITWIQCKQCFNQTPVPIFNPIQSSTYQKIPCGPQCAFPYRCVNRVCTYISGYTGGASSIGDLSIDDFSFGNRHVKMVFGCGTNNTNISFQGKGISGIVGLDQFRHSLVKQLLTPNKRRFSHCLTTGLNKSTLLKFGDDVRAGSSGASTLDFVKQNISNKYYLSLNDISVGKQRLGFPPGTFRLQRNGNGGCYIDSGTVSTTLDEGAYNRVTAEFDRYYISHGLRKLAPIGPLEFCYGYDPRHFKNFIKMTLHFDGSVDYVVDVPNMYAMYPENKIFCVVLRKARGHSVLGAVQQVNMRIVYDLVHQKLHFKAADCARDGH